MPMGNKIALFGMGSMGRVIFAGAAALNLTETKKQETIFDDISKLIEPPDYTALVKIYKKVQQKYNPEKDVLIKNEK